ncbi:LRR and PYD domains-containing 6-like protein [Labeo rohita]|uniref:LRR and PYD domains-containing 6-like protein n=1 Tax=Labeo rohita TaxID=84645 RepID=A0A498NGB5_LABRO|nr:LRR and PYD domains-containing 6-like protein [Labeo rohita]
MAFVKHLLKTIQNLKKSDLKRFQEHLEEDHECISKSEMENADMIKTVDKMVTCFGPEEAVKITVSILRKMKQNKLAEQLENKHKQEAPGAEAEPPPPEVLDQPSVFTVHKILDSRCRGGRLEYLVDWAGYRTEERSWLQNF